MAKRNKKIVEEVDDLKDTEKELLTYQECSKCKSIVFTEVIEYQSNQKSIHVRSDGKVLRRNSEELLFSEVDISYRCDQCGEYHQSRQGILVSL